MSDKVASAEEIMKAASLATITLMGTTEKREEHENEEDNYHWRKRVGGMRSGLNSRRLKMRLRGEKAFNLNNWATRQLIEYV